MALSRSGYLPLPFCTIQSQIFYWQNVRRRSSQILATCNYIGYITIMIRGFRHKGLEKYFLSGTKSGVQSSHLKRLRLVLGRLQASTSPMDMDLPGLHLHELTGNRKGTWSVRVSGNWRITFRFDGKDAVDVDY